MPLPNIIFFDCETNAHRAILDVGALSVDDGAVFHSAHAASLQQFVREHGGATALVAGHNICDFDFPIIDQMTDFAVRPLIDTLYLSALLFPQERFHHLLKDERLRVGELSNPLSDAKKAAELFEGRFRPFSNWRKEFVRSSAICCTTLDHFRGSSNIFAFAS